MQFLLVHNARNRGFLGLHDRRCAGDFDRLRDGAKLEGEVDLKNRRDLKDDAGADLGLETVGGNLDGIRSRIQLRHAVLTGFIGCDLAGDPRTFIGHGDSGSGDSGAGLVADVAY